MTAITPETCTPTWAHLTGDINLQPVAAVPSEPNAIADRLMVQETAARYAVAYDERRLDVIEGLMTEDSTFACRFGEGPIFSQVGRVASLTWLDEIMQSQSDQRRHVMGNLLVEHLSADRAEVVAYTAIYAVELEAKLVTTGMYIFKMTKQDNRWLINNTLVALDRAF